MFRLFLLSLFFLIGCQKAPPTSQMQSVRINIGMDPQTLDPRKARDLTSITLMHMFFEGLTRVSKTGNIEMALAHTVDKSDDGLQYRFHLRESFWSNHEPVTSFDFAESWRSILDPRFPTDIAYQLYGIKNARKVKLGEISLDQLGIHTPDAQTLVVELEHPIPYFLNLVSMTSFFPVPNKALIDQSWTVNPESYLTNGPFKLDSWRRSNSIIASKNPSYWQASSVRLDSIEMLMMGPDTEVQMFDEKKLDWAGSPLSTIPYDSVRAYKLKRDLYISPFSATYFYRINTANQYKDKKNPLSSDLFRKALAFSIDRQSIAEHILQGGQIPAKALVPPEMGLTRKGYFPNYHRERGVSLLSDALLKLDLTLDRLEPIRISYSNNERNAAIAQAVQKQWEETLGIQVELVALEAKVFFQKIAQGDYQIAAGSWTADFSDPINFLEVFKYKDASTNNTSWESSKYVDLLNQSGLCKDSEERIEILREAEQILMDHMPIIPIFHYALNYMRSNQLEEVAISPLGKIDFRWAHMNFETVDE